MLTNPYFYIFGDMFRLLHFLHTFSSHILVENSFNFVKWNVASIAFFVILFSNKEKTYQDMVKLQIVPFWEQYVLIFSVKIVYLKAF